MTKLIIANLAFAMLIANCSGTPAPATVVSITASVSDSPTASQTPAPTAESTSTLELNSPFLIVPAANCCKARALEAGEYELPAWLGIPLTIEVGEGWGVLNEEKAHLLLLAGAGRNEFNDPSQVLVFIAIPDEDPQAVLASIQDSPELTSVGEITGTTIAGEAGGLSGWQFEATAKSNPENEGRRADSIPPGAQPLPAIGKYFAPGFLWTTWTAEPRMRFIALDMEDSVLLLQIESPPAEFNAFASRAHEVLQTLRLLKLHS